MMNDLPKIINERDILHRAGDSGVRITKQQFIKHAGRVTVVEFWHDLTTGRMVQVTSRNPDRLENFALIGVDKS